MNKKIIVSLLGLVVLVLILNFFYVKNESGTELNIGNDNTPTKDENWSIYNNVEYNFSIQYPTSLVYREENSKKQDTSDSSSAQPDFSVSY